MRSMLTIALLCCALPASAADSFSVEASSALEPALTTQREQLALYTLDEPTGFVSWGEALGTTERIDCAEGLALGVEVAGAARGALWFGACRPDELPADLLARVAARGARAATDREFAPLLAGGRAAVAHRTLPGGIALDEFTVLVSGHGLSIMRTVLITPPAGRERFVLQYEALRMCAANDAPLCTAPGPTLDALAAELVARLASR